MPDRFSNLKHYLPPPRGRSQGEPASGADPAQDRVPVRRSRPRVPGNWIRVAGLLTALVVVAVLGGALAARLTLIERPAAPGKVHPVRVASVPSDRDSTEGAVRADRVLGIREHRPPHPRPPQGHRRRPHRVAVVPRVPVLVASSAPRPTGHDRKQSKPRSERKSHRRPSPEPIPAPPGTPLFDCYSGEKVDHFVTTDRASAGQVESSRAKYECDIVGYVYAYPAPHTKAIEVDAGAAYVFAEKDSRTEPSCDKVALYRHETGYDYWYATDESDQGFVGYMKP